MTTYLKPNSNWDSFKSIYYEPMWTLIEGFRHLDPAELDILTDAPVYITILVGAADGNLDREERRWTERLMRTRSYSKPKTLNEFYRVVSTNFLEKVDQKLSELPQDPDDRNHLISRELEKLNTALAKLEHKLASDMYKGFLGLAEETAEASGGFLRIGAISAAERKWIGLPMLTPIHSENTKEEEEDDPEKDELGNDIWSS
jgi:hypothetical protein